MVSADWIGNIRFIFVKIGEKYVWIAFSLELTIPVNAEPPIAAVNVSGISISLLTWIWDDKISLWNLSTGNFISCTVWFDLSYFFPPHKCKNYYNSEMFANIANVL